MIPDPRHIALNVLVSWQRSSGTLDQSLETFSREIDSLSRNDKGLCNALIFGVLRNRNAIDWTLRAFSNTPVEKIEPGLVYLMRIALFQILYMDRIPVFAAINTAVDIAKKTAGKKPAGFVNAVLRAAAKGAPGVSFPDPKKDGAKFISIQYSLPLWLAKKWIQNFGFKATCSLGKQINVIPPITLRTNTLKTDRERLAGLLESRGKNIAFTPAAAQGICFTNPAMPVHEMEEFQLGLFQVQDEAAQIVTEFLAPEPGEKILDTCAGLGGKTGHMAQLMENRGIVVAADLDGRKLESLESEGERLGIDIIQTRQINLLTASINDFDGYFDRVLLDAPCTGLGVLGRNPDTRWKRSRKDIERLAGKQKKMMGTAANLVKPGGILVYAVCSCEREENEAVVQAFLSKRKDFSIDHSFDSDPSCRSTNRFASTQLISAGLLSGGCLKTYPAAANMDGFFAARFKRTLKST